MKREEQNSGESGTSAANASATERTITEIWEEVLNKKGIGPKEDFFDLGGTSLDLIRAIEKVNDTFNVALDGSLLEDDATISRLTRCVESDMQVAS